MNKKMKKLLKIYGVVLSLGYLATPGVGEGASMFTQTLTGDQTIDEENGYLIDSSVEGTLKYQFTSEDNINIQADHSGDPIINFTDIRATAIRVENSITDHIDLTDLKNISVEATGISGVITDQSSSDLDMTLVGIDYLGTGTLAFGNDTTIKIDVAGGHLVNENVEENPDFSSTFGTNVTGISQIVGEMEFGDNTTVLITNQASQVDGAHDLSIYNYLQGISSYSNENLTFGDKTTIKMISENSTNRVSHSFNENSYMRGIVWGDGTLALGDDTTIELKAGGGEIVSEGSQEIGWNNASHNSDLAGVFVQGGGVQFNDNTTILVDYQESEMSGYTGASTFNRLIGIYSSTPGDIVFGDNTNITVSTQNQSHQSDGQLTLNSNLYGIQINGGNLSFGDHTEINTLILNDQPIYSGTSSYNYTTNTGIYLSGPQDGSFGDGTIVRSYTEIGKLEMNPDSGTDAFSEHTIKAIDNQWNSGLISFGDNTKVEASVIDHGASEMVSGISHLTLIGISSFSGGEMTIGDNLSVAVASSGGTYTSRSVEEDTSQWFESWNNVNGILLYGSEKMTIGKDAQINVTAQGANIEQFDALANAYSNINISGVSAQLYGVSESSQFGENTSITVNAKGGNINNMTQLSDTISASGIRLSSDSADIPVLRFGTGTKVFVSAEGSMLENIETFDEYSHVSAYGIYLAGASENSLIFEGDLSVTAIAKPTIWNGVAQTANAYSLFADQSGTLAINDQGIHKIELIGDLGTGEYGIENKVTLDLSGEKSFLQGTAKAQEGNIFLTLANGATWRPQGDGDLEAYFGEDGRLTLNGGGLVDLAWWNNQNGALNPTNQFRTLSINNATLADGGVFRVNSDVLGNQADRINIADGAISGTQYIQVAYDPSMKGTSGVIQAVNGNEPIVLDIQGGTGPDNVTGKTYKSDSPLYQYEIDPTILWDGTQGKISSLRYTRTENLSETPYTVVDAQAAFRNLWKLEGNNMFRRMGDLRLAPEKSDPGLWARVYTGKLDSESSYGRDFDQSYTGWQVGFDKSHEISSGKIHTGLMVNYLDSNPSYHSGSGKLYSTGVGAYGSWIGNNNHYVDVAIRGSNLHNDYNLLDNSGTQVSGKYDAWAYGVSAEYGYRAKLKNNWTIEPQVELSLGHIGSGNHTTSSGLEVNQSSINTSTGRIGVLFGKDFGSENKKGNAYFKASWIHDFSGDGNLSGTFQGDQANFKTAQHRGSGLELNVGTNLKINNKVDTYFELTKTFGAPVDTNWQINGGIRINW